ncbi:MAG: hypothetical protein Q7J78_07815, partial [Clostridiales bacterium]|nr:hypothetical protein [Clostridiales bacterium]
SGGGIPDAIDNRQLMESPADWISPRNEDDEPYREDPVAANGFKVIIVDTDHLWGTGGNIDWVWKSFTRGLNPILMDPYEPIYGMEHYGNDEWAAINSRNHPMWEPIRTNMAYTVIYAEQMNLEAAIPRADLASSGYCLADFTHEYLVYNTGEREVEVDLGGENCIFSVEWMNPYNGENKCESFRNSQKIEKFTNPFNNSAVLYIKRAAVELTESMLIRGSHSDER